VEWPEPLRITPLAEGPSTWQFVSDDTWYPGDEVVEFLESTVSP
jgi:hypothetical protein